jgi:choline dehydrogenase-like flavoprotein
MANRFDFIVVGGRTPIRL